MTAPIRPTASPIPVTPAKAGDDDARLRKTARDLEGLFVEQLYKAMRETVPQGEGVVDGGSGEDMFTTLMDQRLAADTPTQWAHGLAEAAYRQLRRAVTPAQAGVPAENVPSAEAGAPAALAAHTIR